MQRHHRALHRMTLLMRKTLLDRPQLPQFDQYQDHLPAFLQVQWCLTNYDLDLADAAMFGEIEIECC